MADNLKAAGPSMVYDTVSLSGDRDIHVSDGSKSSALWYRDQDDNDPEFSPDGKRLLYVSAGVIQVATARGRNERALVIPSANANVLRWPSWSPDGRKIVYVQISSSDYVESSSIVVAMADGSRKKVLYSEDGPSFLAGPAWSPDGRSIVFGRYLFAKNTVLGSPLPVSDVLLIQADGTGVREIGMSGPGADVSPEWTGEGLIVLVSARGCGVVTTAVCSGIYELDPETDEFHEIASPLRDWTGDGVPDQVFDAIPSPRGRKMLLGLAAPGRGRQLWIWDRKDDAMRLVTDTYSGNATWNPRLTY